MRCGTDLIEISRIGEAIERNPAFIERVFSPAEIEYYMKKKNGLESLAGFFAAKEAFSKYLGSGISGFNLKDVSVEHNEDGTPFILFKGVRQDVSLSISHSTKAAMAVVCGSAPCPEPPLKAEMQVVLPKRPKDSHKGDFGKVLVVAGSRGMTGAAVLSAYSALRAGAGLVTLATVESERAIAAGFYPEIMTEGLKAKDGIISTGAIKELFRLSVGKDVIVFGPGLGQSLELPLILEELLRNYTGQLIIDADGLNALSKNINMLKDKSCDVILTPHPGEMSRLLGETTKYIQKNRVSVATKLSNTYGVLTVLKGSETIVSEGRQLYVNPTGNPGMATAGTGDALTGIIAAFAAQGLSAFDAAKLGVYIHGLAGDIASEVRGMHGMVASDVLDAVPEAILRISK